MTGNVSLFSKMLTVDDFQLFLQKKGARIFDLENISGSISTSSGDIYFYYAVESIRQERKVKFEIGTAQGSDELMAKIIYSFYSNFPDAILIGDFVMIFDSNHFIEAYNRFENIDVDYYKIVTIFLRTEFDRKKFEVALGAISVDIIECRIANLPPISKSYFFVDIHTANSFRVSVELKVSSINQNLINLLLGFSKKSELLIGVAHTYRLLNEDLDKFRDHTVHFF